MGLFDRFKKQKQNTLIQEILDKAHLHASRGDHKEALRALSEGFKIEITHPGLYPPTIELLGKIGAIEEKRLFQAVLDNPESNEPYRDIGIHFFHATHYDLAVPFLEKSLCFNPCDPHTANDLAVAYARKFNLKRAREVLETAAGCGDFWMKYFLLKVKILLGETKKIQSEIDELFSFLGTQNDVADTFIPEIKLQELQEVLFRMEKTPNPGQHIRDWHFIQYGSVILDYFEQPEEYVAGGRYVARWHTEEAVHRDLLNLKKLLNGLDHSVEVLMHLPDRLSTIVGHAAGKVLGLEPQVYQGDFASGQTLMIAGHSSDYNDFPELSSIEHKQVLFALNHDWLNCSYLCPDIIGSMSQMYVSPWEGGGFQLDENQPGQIVESEPDLRSPEEIAAGVLQTEPGPDHFGTHIDFYLQRKDWIKGIGRSCGSQRFNFMVESPVPGSYFR